MQLEEHVHLQSGMGTRVWPESHQEDKMGTGTNSATASKGEGKDLVQYKINLFVGESVV